MLALVGTLGAQGGGAQGGGDGAAAEEELGQGGVFTASARDPARTASPFGRARRGSRDGGGGGGDGDGQGTAGRVDGAEKPRASGVSAMSGDTASSGMSADTYRQMEYIKSLVEGGDGAAKDSPLQGRSSGGGGGGGVKAVQEALVGAAQARHDDSGWMGESPLQRPPGAEGVAVPPGAPTPPRRERGPSGLGQERQRSAELAGTPAGHAFPSRGEEGRDLAPERAAAEITAPRLRSPSRREIAAASTELFPGHLADRELAERAWQLQTLLHQAHESEAALRDELQTSASRYSELHAAKAATHEALDDSRLRLSDLALELVQLKQPEQPSPPQPSSPQKLSMAAGESLSAMLGCMGGRRDRVSPPRLRSPARPGGPSPHRSGPRWEADPSQRFPDPPPQLHPALRERQRQDRRAAKERRAAKQEQTANGGREERAPSAHHGHAAAGLDPNELPFRIDGPPDLGPDGFPGSRFGSPPEIVF